MGIPYCKGALQSDGCLYGNSMNPYMPQKQRTSLDLEFDKFENQVIDHIREEDKNIPLVTVLLAGRPMFIDKILAESTAVLDAFLPGTSGGQGIVDGLTGAYKLRPNGSSDSRNTLSFDWPKNSVILFLFRLKLKTSHIILPMVAFPRSVILYLKLVMVSAHHLDYHIYFIIII